MPQPFGIGDVVGGRYRITHHVVTSADQDIIFQATDQVLGRQVSVLLASRANAKQVATSAKELASGARSSAVEVLDLGLAEDRTFLISSMVDPNQLLDLVVPDTAPYVEPYYTDSLGSELFGQSREIAPHTYEDDAEYYAQLHAGRTGRETPLLRRRPSFLDKVTPGHRSAGPADELSYTQEELESELASAGDAHGLTISQEIARLSFSLRTDMEVVEADSAADRADEHIEAVHPLPDSSPPLSPDLPDLASGSSATVQPDEEQKPEGEAFGAALPGGPFTESAQSSALPVVAAPPAPEEKPDSAVDELQAEGEEVVDDPPAEPDSSFDLSTVQGGSAPQTSVPGAPAAASPGAFTSLISAVPSREPSSFPAAEDPAAPAAGEPQQAQGAKVPLSRWAAITALAVMILIAAVIVFIVLTG